MKIKLHTQIVLGLLLGAIFGSVFHIDQHKLEINSLSSKKTVKDWSEISFYRRDSLMKTFDSESQVSVIKYFTSIKDKKIKDDLKVDVKYPSGEIQMIDKISSVSKVRTIGVMLKPIGDIFIRLLMMIAVPLVLGSLIVGAASLSDLKHIAKIGGKTLG
nr:cation:dicarboxylase symporter family transporter [Bacteroidota bacterium]